LFLRKGLRARGTRRQVLIPITGPGILKRFKVEGSRYKIKKTVGESGTCFQWHLEDDIYGRSFAKNPAP
jgi:hypothetical protein